MSGGSYDYLHGRDNGTAAEYRSMAATLRRRCYGCEDAADALEALALLKERAQAEHEALSKVLQGVEWLESCDWGPDQISTIVNDWRKTAK